MSMSWIGQVLFCFDVAFLIATMANFWLRHRDSVLAKAGGSSLALIQLGDAALIVTQLTALVFGTTLTCSMYSGLTNVGLLVACFTSVERVVVVLIAPSTSPYASKITLFTSVVLGAVLNWYQTSQLVAADLPYSSHECQAFLQQFWRYNFIIPTISTSTAVVGVMNFSRTFGIGLFVKQLADCSWIGLIYFPCLLLWLIPAFSNLFGSNFMTFSMIVPCHALLWKLTQGGERIISTPRDHKEYIRIHNQESAEDSEFTQECCNALKMPTEASSVVMKITENITNLALCEKFNHQVVTAATILLVCQLYEIKKDVLLIEKVTGCVVEENKSQVPEAYNELYRHRKEIIPEGVVSDEDIAKITSIYTALKEEENSSSEGSQSDSLSAVKRLKL